MNTKCGVSREIVGLELKKFLCPWCVLAFPCDVIVSFPLWPRPKLTGRWTNRLCWINSCHQISSGCFCASLLIFCPLLYVKAHTPLRFLPRFWTNRGEAASLQQLYVSPALNQSTPSIVRLTTHPFFHIKGMSSLSLLCKLVLILYTWPSGTEAQLWLIETTKKRVIAIYPRSLRNRRRGRLGTEIAKGQGGRPVVGAHLSRSLCTCMYKHTDKSHTGL